MFYGGVAIVPEPRISAIMNNCLLHAITPELCLMISTMSDEILQAYPGYEHLKKSFADFYQLPEDFDWQHFSQLLSQYNPFDVQMILGPVLRRVIEENLVNVAEDHDAFDGKTKQEFVEDMLTLGENGRYQMLDPFILMNFLTNDLGLTLKIQKYGEQCYVPVSPIDGLVSSLQHAGEDDASYHFERGIDPIDYSQSQCSRLNFITQLINEESKVETLFLIDLIRRHVKATHELHNTNSTIELELKNLKRFREKTFELIVDGHENPRYQAYCILKEDESFQLPLEVIGIANHDAPERIINEMYQKLEQKIVANYNESDRGKLLELSRRICEDLKLNVKQLHKDASTDDLKSMFVNKLNELHEKTLEYKGFFEILRDAIVYAFKKLLFITQPPFSLQRGFFEQDRLENYLPSQLHKVPFP